MEKINDVITALLDIQAQVVQYTKYIECLRNENNQLKQRKCDCTTNELDGIIIKKGDVLYRIAQESLYNLCYYSWHSLTRHRDSNGDIYFGDFNEFIHDCLNYENFPKSMSLDEILSFLNDYLIELYDEKLSKAFMESDEDD